MHNVHLEADERVSQRDRDVRVQIITFALKLQMSEMTRLVLVHVLTLCYM